MFLDILIKAGDGVFPVEHRMVGFAQSDAPRPDELDLMSEMREQRVFGLLLQIGRSAQLELSNGRYGNARTPRKFVLRDIEKRPCGAKNASVL